MSVGKNLFDDIFAAIESRNGRFLGLYSKGEEGVLHTRTLHKSGERVYLWTSRFGVAKPEEKEALLNRLTFLAESGVVLLPIIDLGIDAKGVAFLLTQWKEVDTVARAASSSGFAEKLFDQMTAHIGRLHAGGMPFGDLTEDSFYFDASLGRVGLCGIPAFGFPLPHEQSRKNYLPPERINEKEIPFERDIYGLGVYAHQLFVGSSFPRPASKKELETYIEERIPELLEPRAEELPPWADWVLGGTLRWDPKERLPISELCAVVRGRRGILGSFAQFFRGLVDIGFSIFSLRRLRLGLGGWVVLGGAVAIVGSMLVMRFTSFKVGSLGTSSRTDRSDAVPLLSGTTIEVRPRSTPPKISTGSSTTAPETPTDSSNVPREVAPTRKLDAPADREPTDLELARPEPSATTAAIDIPVPLCKDVRIISALRDVSESYRLLEAARCRLEQEK